MKQLAYIILVNITMLSCKEYVDTPLSPAEKRQVAAVQLTERPKPSIKLNIEVEDQVRLIGLDVSKPTIRAGERLVVTFYLEAMQASMEDNHIFIHFQCRGAKGFQNLDGKSITQRLLPLRKLKKGDMIADRIDFSVNRGCQSGRATLYWGLFRGADRLKFKDAPSGSVSNDGRLIAAKFQVRSLPKPIMTARSTTAPVEVDGKLLESDWQKAVPITLTHIGGHRAQFQPTQIRAMFDEAYVYLAAVATDSDIWSTFNRRDSNTWEQEVLEVFIDANGKGRNYLELQVTPKNIVFDAKFVRHRSPLPKARLWNMQGLETAVTVDGTLNQRDDTDRRYTVEMKIPIAQVPNGADALAKGEWRINFFRFDQAKDRRQIPSGWSHPPVPDFHHLASFGRLKFAPKPSSPSSK